MIKERKINAKLVNLIINSLEKSSSLREKILINTQIIAVDKNIEINKNDTFKRKTNSKNM